MTTREDIRRIAGDHGWFIRPGDYKYSDTYQRFVQLDGTQLDAIAKKMGWLPMEEILIVWSDNGGVSDAYLRTPDQQAAIDGQFVGSAKSVDSRTKGKKETVIGWFSADPWSLGE